MAGLATRETNKSVDAFINSIDSPSKKEDAMTLVAMMEEVSGHKAKIWGDNFIIGFGKCSYKRKQGKEEFEWFNMGFAPRKAKITIYLTLDLSKEEKELKKLGKCTWGKGCLYINSLKNIDKDRLKDLMIKSKNSTWH